MGNKEFSAKLSDFNQNQLDQLQTMISQLNTAANKFRNTMEAPALTKKNIFYLNNKISATTNVYEPIFGITGAGMVKNIIAVGPSSGTLTIKIKFKDSALGTTKTEEINATASVPGGLISTSGLHFNSASGKLATIYIAGTTTPAIASAPINNIAGVVGDMFQTPDVKAGIYLMPSTYSFSYSLGIDVKCTTLNGYYLYVEYAYEPMQVG